MSGLYGSLFTALSALQASQQALEITANNVANANTPGYARERAVLVPGNPITLEDLSFGTGVVLQKLQSLRDPILDLRISQSMQDQGKLNTALGALQQLQAMFSSTDSGIGNAMGKLFESFQQLSTDPSNLSLRQGVLTAAGNLTTVFNNTARNLQTQRSSLDLNVGQTVDEINTLTGQISKLNQQISSLENVGEDASLFIDQRTNAIQQLSELIDVQVIRTESGITLTTGSGALLVSDGHNFELSRQTGTDGMQHVLAQNIDITAQISSGKLGGLIEVRDHSIPDLQDKLDQLAGSLATALNAANHQGFDLDGLQGGDIFAAPPAGNVGAASALRVSMTDPSLLAASSDGSQGSNGNIANFMAVHDNPLVNGQSPTEYYASIVFQIGSNTANTSADLDAAGQILQQLRGQQNSVSGVSLDEEAANIVQYQTAYQAAARVVATIQTLLLDTVNLGASAVQQ